jgi:hypothetical protein
VSMQSKDVFSAAALVSAACCCITHFSFAVDEALHLHPSIHPSIHPSFPPCFSQPQLMPVHAPSQVADNSPSPSPSPTPTGKRRNKPKKHLPQEHEQDGIAGPSLPGDARLPSAGPTPNATANRPSIQPSPAPKKRRGRPPKAQSVDGDA